MLYHEPSQILFSGDSIVAGIAPFRSFEIINTAFPAFSLDAQSCHQAVREFIREAPPIEVLCSGHGPVVRGPISEKLKRLEEIQ